MVVPPAKTPGGPRSIRTRRRRRFIVAGVVVLALVSILGAFTLLDVLEVSVSICAGCPPAWMVGPGPAVQPGQMGCQDVPGEECYAVQLASNVAGVHLSGLRFDVVGPPWNNTSVLNSTPVALGPSALVSAFNSTGDLVGVWNWTLSSWSQGEAWPIPVGPNVLLILDTGLQNVQLKGDLFFTFLTSPNYGSVGMPL
jgi:hypothetical protein